MFPKPSVGVRRSIRVLLTFTLIFFTGMTGCTENKPVTAAEGVATAQNPLSPLHEIYVLPTPDFGAFHDKRRRPNFYTARIHETALAKEDCFRRTWGMDDLDFDFIVPGQDFKIDRFDIAILSQQGDAATASVRFENLGEAYDLRYSLKRSEGNWLIDNVSYNDRTLLEALSSPCGKP